MKYFLFALSLVATTVLAGTTSVQDPSTRNFLKIFDDGSISVNGASGSPGPTGPTGPQGIQGSAGVKGDTGNQGVKGDTGSQGVKGDTGEQGSAGVEGDTGSQGVKGDTGSIGPGVPSGGGLNQTLQKKSASDYDTRWIDLTHNSLSGIQGGASSDYQHLTTAQVTALGNAVPNTVTVNAHALSGNVVISGSDITTGTLGTGVGGTNLTTYTKGDIVHASSTNVLGKLALGSVGQLLGVDPSGVPAWQNPIDTLLNHPSVFDDFTGVPGESGWSTSVLAPGTSAFAAIAGHPGIFQLVTGASSPSRSDIYRNYNIANVLLGSGVYTSDFVVMVPVLSNATDEFSFRFGLFNNPTVDPTASYHGVTFNYDRATNGDYWAGKTAASGGTNTLVFDGGSGRATLAAVAGDWMHFRFIVNSDATSVSFYAARNSGALTLLGTINAAGAISTSMGVSSAFLLLHTAGNVSRTVNIDVYYHRYDLTNAR